MRKIDRTGEGRVNKFGSKMIRKEYRSSIDIDVMFDDGTIIKHTNYLNFKKKNIAKPGFKKINNENKKCY